MSQKELKIKIGYIPEAISIKNEVLVMEPVQDLKKLTEEIKVDFFNDKRFCFPTVSNKKYSTMSENGELVNELVSSSPLYQPELFKFVNTHSFELGNGFSSGELNDFENNPTFFLLQIIAYVSGYRVMPEKFWFDGKIPIKSTNNIICTNYDPVIRKALELWLNKSKEAKGDLSSIFYFFNRSPSYHWHFEKFSHDFTVFDAAMKFHGKENLVKFDSKTKYSDFLNHLGIKFDSVMLKELINLRNNLFHQMKWKDGGPGLSDDNGLTDKTITFRRMLHAVLGRILCLHGSYFSQDWSCRGTLNFDAH